MTEMKNQHPSFQELLAAGDFSGLVARAQKLQQESALDAERMEWLFAQARGWHAAGLMAHQHAICEIVLAQKADHFEALHLLGHEAQADGDFERAETFYTRALAVKPDYAFARLALAQLRMQKTFFKEGRDQYEARFEAVTEANGPDWRGLPVPRWRGEPLAGKKIYLWAEQGLGDIVMFAGFLPWLLMQKPARVALGMFPKLITLFQRSFPQVSIEQADDAIHQALAPSVMTAYPQIEKLSRITDMPFPLAPLKASYEYVSEHGVFDYAAPLADLMVYGLPDYVPAGHPPHYIKADPERIMAVRHRLKQKRGEKRVGIAWATTNRREWMRNIPLEAWLPVLAAKNCHFISLQHGVSESEIAAFRAAHDCHITVEGSTDLLSDAEGLAALIAGMDEVITIDNSTIHLAGALNVPATLLLPKGHNFRWPVLPGSGTLWYPDVTVLRQRQSGDWDDVMKEAAAKIQ